MGNKITYEDSSTEYYYIRNGQGNITGLFDGSGADLLMLMHCWRAFVHCSDIEG